MYQLLASQNYFKFRCILIYLKTTSEVRFKQVFLKPNTIN